MHVYAYSAYKITNNCTLCINTDQWTEEFITKLYEISAHSEGLTTLHKLKYQIPKMRVDLAALV